MGDPEMVGDRWEQEVTGPDGRGRIVVAVRRHAALHGDATPSEARGEAAALLVQVVADGIRAWRSRRNPGWTVAVLSRPGLKGQQVLHREDLPFDADPVARAREVAEQVRRGELAP